jgi:hypothetical protein
MRVSDARYLSLRSLCVRVRELRRRVQRRTQERQGVTMVLDALYGHSSRRPHAACCTVAAVECHGGVETLRGFETPWHVFGNVM